MPIGPLKMLYKPLFRQLEPGASAALVPVPVSSQLAKQLSNMLHIHGQVITSLKTSVIRLRVPLKQQHESTTVAPGFANLY